MTSEANEVDNFWKVVDAEAETVGAVERQDDSVTRTDNRHKLVSFRHIPRQTNEKTSDDKKIP